MIKSIMFDVLELNRTDFIGVINLSCDFIRTNRGDWRSSCYIRYIRVPKYSKTLNIQSLSLILLKWYLTGTYYTGLKIKLLSEQIPFFKSKLDIVIIIQIYTNKICLTNLINVIHCSFFFVWSRCGRAKRVVYR